MIVPYRFVPPEYGGQKTAYTTCLNLDQKMDFACISTTDNAMDKVPFQLFRVFGKNISKYLNPLVAWRCIKVMQSIHSSRCIIFQPFMAPLLVLPLKLSGIRLEIYIQNMEFQRFRSMGKFWWPLVFLIEFLAYRQALRLYFISKEELDQIVKIFSLDPRKCWMVPYGIDLRRTPADLGSVRKIVGERHGFHPEEFLILFYGLLSYHPNLQAVERIISDINPRLSQLAGFKYRMIICGRGLPDSRQVIQTNPNLDYLGHVEDISEYIKAADLVINPVTSGAGVKTKIIEAIALGKTVVSSRSGAAGIEQRVCGKKLVLIEDNEHEAFCEAIVRFREEELTDTPSSFYEYYHSAKTILPMLVA
jgi:polysaccharide biosynthesis protein PslH